MADNVIEEEGRDKQGSSCKGRKMRERLIQTEKESKVGSERYVELENREYKVGIWRLEDAGDRKNRRETDKSKQTI